MISSTSERPVRGWLHRGQRKSAGGCTEVENLSSSEHSYPLQFQTEQILIGVLKVMTSIKSSRTSTKPSRS